MIADNEMAIRLGFFFGLFFLFALLESWKPRRKLDWGRRRWPTNLLLVFINSLAVRVLFPGAAVAMALWTQSQGLGLFNWLQWPWALSLLLSLLALDFVIWLQHLAMHHVPWLWRLHRVHHADLDFDVSTGLRFHPLEIVFSMLVKFSAILILGPSVIAVIVFEVLLNATSMFNHSNLNLPLGLDRILRWFVVTPDMHRVHHSSQIPETNSNFGFNLPWWDRLFGTYRAQPQLGHENMEIGLSEERDFARCATMRGLLLMPFKRISGKRES